MVHVGRLARSTDLLLLPTVDRAGRPYSCSAVLLLLISGFLLRRLFNFLPLQSFPIPIVVGLTTSNPGHALMDASAVFTIKDYEDPEPGSHWAERDQEEKSVLQG